MSQFKFYHDDWLDIQPYINACHDPQINKCTLSVNLDTDFFKSIAFDSESVREYRVSAAKSCSELLGSKPALCLSGGIDSQATWQCFHEANIDIDVFVLVFKNNLNSHDVEHAIRFAEYKNIRLNFIDIDIINFLSRENNDYSIKYKSLSPHFNTHYKLCNILHTKGYTGFVCGGNPPFLSKHMNTFHEGYSQNFLNYINYSNHSGLYCQGNFLGFYPKLTWAISLMTEMFYHPLLGKPLTLSERQELESLRYQQKIKGYRKAGFDIIPQTQKYTGFELVKLELEKMYNDGWAFEKLYRNILTQNMHEVLVDFKLKQEVIDAIMFLNSEHS